MLGISMYFSDIDYTYLKKASELGTKYVFTSLHIPEEDLTTLEQDLPRVLEFCKKHDLALIPDMSPLTFEKLNLPTEDFMGLSKLGFEYIRLDFGYDDLNTVLSLTKHFKVVLNGSTIDRKFLEDARDIGIDLSQIMVLHNFYPKTDTGLPLEYFLELNRVFDEFGIASMAFVPGDYKKRLPLYEGLPTLEKHRSIHPYIAALELMQVCKVTDVLIGDNQASLETLKYISDYIYRDEISVPIHIQETNFVLEESYAVRKDSSENVIRLLSPRLENIPIEFNNQRQRGSITVENSLAGRYCGEINILKENFPMSVRSNVLGWIHPEYTDIVNYINSKDKIKFIFK